MCGKEISKWRGFATLVCYDEVEVDVIGLRESHLLSEKAYICPECWEKIIKNIDKIKQVLETKGVEKG